MPRALPPYLRFVILPDAPLLDECRR